MSLKPSSQSFNNGTLLDRLIDDPDDVSGQSLSISRLRNGLRRDLEGLLNTRRRFLSWPDELGELDKSLISYGLLDFTNGAINSNAFRNAFIYEVEQLIRRLEPRILSFEVSIIENKTESDRILRFRIVGTVDLGGERQQISFDNHLDPVRCVIVQD